MKCRPAYALGQLGEHAKEQAPKLGELLKDQDRDVRSSAADALGKLGEHAIAESDRLIEALLIDSNSDNGRTDESIKMGPVFDAISRVRSKPCDLKQVVRLMAHCYARSHETMRFRFQAHFLGGGERENEILIRWLGYPNPTPDVAADDEASNPKKLLEVFESVWSDTGTFPKEVMQRTQDELALRIGAVVTGSSWTAEDRELLVRLARLLGQRSETAAIHAVLTKLDQQKWFRRGIWTAGLHGTFWLLLIFVYPFSRPVQTVFFWNKWVRRLFGVGYVGLTLKWIPPLRQRLFAPFRDSLLTQRALDEFNPNKYFTDSLVQFQSRGNTVTQPLTMALPSLSGTVVLEGDSGLGKT